MHLSYSHYICLFLFNFCGFFSVSEAGFPSSLHTAKLRKVIDYSSKWSHGKPLTFYTPLDETCLVNQTDCSRFIIEGFIYLLSIVFEAPKAVKFYRADCESKPTSINYKAVTYTETEEAGSNAWAPSSSIAKKLRATIDASSKWSHGKPLTFYTPLDETCMVNRTQCSIKVTLQNKVTVATMTGGPRGNNVYQFYTYSFSWKACECTGTYDFKADVIYFNAKYGSYDEALTHWDGIAVVTFPITTSGNFSNPKFDEFGKFMECQLKDHKSVGKIKSAHTYIWFVNFPHGGIYHTCTQKYRDQDMGKQTTAIVILLPSDPGVNFISSNQFQIFLKMGNTMGQFSELGTCSSNFETYKGIVVYKLLA